MTISMAMFHLLTTAPQWFVVSSQEGHEFSGHAVILPEGAAVEYEIGLIIICSERTAEAHEKSGNNILPKYCPERHINSDASFCLGIDIPALVTQDAATVWWGLLRQYLVLQYVADRTRSWPGGHFIAHGEAGPHHRRARAAAAELGILAEYDEAVLGAAHWVNDGSVRISDDSARLVNGRSRCPVGCRDQRKRPKLRVDCCQKHTVLELMLAERNRREFSKQFWERQRKNGATCCGTLRDCPLK